MSRKAINVKIFNNPNVKKKTESKQQKEDKEEKSIEINSCSISEQNIKQNNKVKRKIVNNEILSKENDSEEREDPLQIIRSLDRDKENSSSNRTIKFRNQKKLSNNYTETNTNTNADFLQRTERILKKRRRNSFKRVSAIDNNNEEIINIEEIHQLTIRQKLSHFFETNKRLFYIRIIVSLLNTLSFIYYIICTYYTSLYKSLNYIDFFICFAVIIEHIIDILLAHHVCKYLLSFESIINFFIEIPPFFSLLCSDYITNKFYRFINITRVFRLTKCYIIMDIYQNGEKSVNSQILNIILSIVLIIFTFAGVVQMFDLEDVLEELKIAYLPETKYYLEHRKEYHHYLYFIIVSLTTVGYGDITPKSFLSQLTMLVFVFFILAVIPSQTDELINLSNAQTIYERKVYISNPDIPFVVLLGNIELEILKSFCEEYFHSDHGKFYRHIVILTNQYPHKAFEYFLMEKDNSKFIYYLQGNPMKKENLIRADILKAKSCIIFCDKNARDLLSEDQKEIFLALYVKKFYYMTTLDNLIAEREKNAKLIQSSSSINAQKLLKGNTFKIFLQLNKTESPIYYYGALQNHYKRYLAKDQLLIIENLKMNLLSKSCITPGIISLLYNLIISASTGNMFGKNMPEWIKEYIEGNQYEIYKFQAEGELLNINFPQLAIEIFNKYHSLLIALEINYKGHSLIKLNPQTNENICEIIEKNISKFDTKGKEDNIITISNDSIAEEEESPSDKVKKLIKIRNSIKIYFYLISKDKEIIEVLQKMDSTKIGISALKSRFRKSLAKIKSSNYDDQRIGQNSTYRTLRSDFHRPTGVRNYRKSRTRVQFTEEENSESEESSSTEEEIDMKEIISEILNNLDKYEEKQKIINNYYTVEGFENNNLNNDIKLPDIKDRRDIKDHVIICGMHSEILHFILPLRAKYLTKKMLKWIVILSPNLSKDIQDILSIFPKIVYIQGDPLYPENLHKCNISTAEIAVILSNNFFKYLKRGLGSNSNQDFMNESDFGNSQDDINKLKMEGQFLDSSTLFIYNSIKKINSSIKIITELLYTSNIEFLLSSKYLHTLYADKNNSSKNDFNKNGGNRMNYKISPNYELTPVFATGEIYLPSLGDKILAQMFYNTNLLTIVNLILEGDKYIMKSKEKKLNDIFQLTGSNLFMIPCELKNESFGEFFKRMLAKNGILCIALYRKNLVDNFYYVYTNPRKTTLIKETDFIFVLAGTQSIDRYYEQNEAKIAKLFEKDKQSDFNEIDGKNDNKEQAFVARLQESIKKQYLQLRKNKNISNNSINKDENLISLENTNMDFMNNFDIINDEQNLYRNNREINDKQRHSIFFNIANYENAKSKKNYKDVEELQKQINKTMEKLKKLNINFNDFEKDIDSHIKNEVKKEFLIYLSKVK